MPRVKVSPPGVPPEVTAVAEVPSPRRFKVEVHWSPTLTLEAMDAQDAWIKYKAVTGLIATSNPIVITEVPPGVSED